MKRKKRWWGIWARGAVTAFSLFVALDTFVIPASYSSVKASDSTLFSELESRAAAESTAATATESTAAAAAESTATAATVAESTAVATADSDVVTASAGGLSGTSLGTAKTDDYSITVTKYQEYDTAIYVADITVSSAEIIKTALADDTYGKNITAYTSTIASENQAVLAINGDYYGAQESGYVIRNGVAYRETSDGEDILVLYADGSMKVLDSDDVTVQELLDQGVWQAWSFGPGLLSDGEVTVGENTEVSRAMNSNPRTAIGQIDDNHYVFVVSDGRTDESKGLSLYELAEFMESLGCRTAYNLDGGGSSTMYFNGSVINNPTTNGRIKERAVSDIVYIG
ncbi:phosphodiester glycosidase family protein [Porcincola intestinalis]|uniref:Phosphodiester glycosidase family protein n=1 Tax=Porcincola intestinalis TaxID=2606632 RepID=A0A6L5X210_9FIRM|nr:phosphodiester glycosidase family protein [Porcincola intestinalis]MSS14240.1 phosphodiester glycosidase family protein [Porcincola intestinalis]